MHLFHSSLFARKAVLQLVVYVTGGVAIFVDVLGAVVVMLLLLLLLLLLIHTNSNQFGA